MIVVDTNVIAYFWIKGECSVLAETVLERDPDWIVPILWKAEFRNVLATYIRSGKVDIETAITTYQLAEESFQNREHWVSFDKILRLASQSRCTAYDCEFIALAQQMNTFLVTEDKPLQKAFPEIALSIESFLEM